MLHFAGVWWAFVFPLGMYSAATYTMATEIGQRSLLTVSLVFFWDALAAWLIVTLTGLLLALRVRWLARANRDPGRPQFECRQGADGEGDPHGATHRPDPH